MRNVLVSIAVAVAPLAAMAEGEGFEFGARVSYAMPSGDVGGDGSGNGVPFDTWVDHAFPIEVDVGYRFDARIYAGIYGGYIPISRQYCETGNCSDHGLRVGAQVQFHPLGQAPFDPWLGLGSGYEWLSFSQRFPTDTDERGLEGFEFAILQAGFDFGMTSTSPVIKLGPVLTFSLAEFRRETFGSGGVTYVDDRRLHHWLTLGFRARFLP
jgi:hypothetical protein